ncbi:MAG: putative Zn-dependent peptidase [Bacteroidetes bacterium OLB11]|nr:MAG: putative Zn-dependent peptidase [Bacteroidetes bacterium OLB11]
MRYYAQYGERNPFNNELSNDELDQIQSSELVDILHSIINFKHKILYYGPEESESLTKKLNKSHTLPYNFKAIPEIKRYTFNKVQNNEVLFTDYDMVQSEIQWFRNGDDYNPNQVPIISIFNEYFGGNMSGIVFQDIRESKALAYSTYASFGSPQRKNEPFYTIAYVGCQADKMKESIAAMQNLLNDLPKSEKLFNNSKAGLKNVISTSRTTKTSLLFSYLNALKKGIQYDMNEKTYKELDHFTFEDIQKFHSQNIAKKPYTLTVLGKDDKMNWDELKKYGTIKKLSLEDIFGY